MPEERGAANNNNIGSDLLVDFGRRRSRGRPGTCDGDDDGDEVARIRAIKKDRQVSFSAEVAVHCSRYPKNEVSKRWYSTQDKEVFKEQTARDVAFIQYLQSFTSMEALEKEALYWFVGLEAHISEQVTRFVKELRQRHSRSIVEMQDYLSERLLSAYAESHSSESRERAQMIAAGYWEILS